MPQVGVLVSGVAGNIPVNDPRKNDIKVPSTERYITASVCARAAETDGIVNRPESKM